MCVLDMQLYPSVFIHPVFLDEIVCLWPPKFTCYYPSLPLLFFFIRMFIFVSYVVIVFSIYIYIVLAVSPYKYYTDVVSLTLQYLDVTFVFCFIFSLIFIALRELTSFPWPMLRVHWSAGPGQSASSILSAILKAAIFVYVFQPRFRLRHIHHIWTQNHI